MSTMTLHLSKEAAHQITMKSILALSVLVAVATADTCTDCTVRLSISYFRS